MLGRLLRRRGKEQDDMDFFIVERKTFGGKTQNQFGRGKIVDADMRYGNPRADGSVVLVVLVWFLGSKMAG